MQRLFKPADYSRMSGGGGFIWEAYSQESVEKNLKTFFGNFSSAYLSIVEQNFPLVRDHLMPFDGATRVIVVFDVKDHYKSYTDGPRISFWYLKCENESSLHIDLLKKDQSSDLETKLEETRMGDSIELDGNRYKYIGGHWGVLDFIYTDLPMFDFIYAELKRALAGFLDSKLPQGRLTRLRGLS